MVELPMHYRKFETDGTKRRVRISEYPLPGYHLVGKRYVSASQATIPRRTTAGPRPQRHHVALEPCQHLRRHLSADTACGETVRVEERGMSRVPPFGNRIPDEDDLRSYCKRRIGSRIPSRIRPIPRLASG